MAVIRRGQEMVAFHHPVLQSDISKYEFAVNSKESPAGHAKIVPHVNHALRAQLPRYTKR